LYIRFRIRFTGGYCMDSMISSFDCAAESGNSAATDALFSALYSELHRLAKRELNRQWAPMTLGVTTLLHEAYLDMAGRNDPSFPDHARFMGYAARVMRGLIIDHARNRGATKRGGKLEFTSLEGDVLGQFVDVKELSLISDSLDQLAKVEPDLAAVVDLKFFCGFSFGEIAVMQELSERTVQWKWEKARIYLRNKMHTAFSL
jgi:RNA polymerase sigma factor (TIGR02999 family)